MKKFAWATDIHLDFIDGPEDVGRVQDEFALPLSNIECDGVFITGDISRSDQVTRHLHILDSLVDKPIYFILGNHDFYGSDFEATRRSVDEVCSKSKNLKYLTRLDQCVSLTSETALIGHDGWYDASFGDPMTSSYLMSDWLKIENFNMVSGIYRVPMGIEINKTIIVDYCRYLAFEAAEHIKTQAEMAAKNHKTVVILTHVPPFLQLHKPGGRTSSEASFPWYTSKLVGDAITDVSRRFPEVRFEVFCGHTHEKFDANISDNLSCHVGGSVYGEPDIVGTILIS